MLQQEEMAAYKYLKTMFWIKPFFLKKEKQDILAALQKCIGCKVILMKRYADKIISSF